MVKMVNTRAAGQPFRTFGPPSGHTISVARPLTPSAVSEFPILYQVRVATHERYSVVQASRRRILPIIIMKC